MGLIKKINESLKAGKSKKGSRIDKMTSEEFLALNDTADVPALFIETEWFEALSETEKQRILKTMNQVDDSDLPNKDFKSTKVTPRKLESSKKIQLFPKSNLFKIIYKVPKPANSEEVEFMRAMAYIGASDLEQKGEVTKLNIVVIKSNGEQILFEGVDVFRTKDGKYYINFNGYIGLDIPKELLSVHAKFNSPGSKNSSGVKGQKTLSAEQIVSDCREINIRRMYNYEYMLFQEKKRQQLQVKRKEELKKLADEAIVNDQWV